MKYNIITVSNSSYFIFLKIWIQSLFDKIDLENVNKVHIINTGLKEEEKKYLKQFPKIDLYETGVESKFTELHGKGWSDSNYSKLPAIRKILKEQKIPCYFVDVDCVFNQDFYEILDFTKDIVVCDTSDRIITCSSRLIGSFYGFNNVEKSLDFIDRWYDKILFSKDIKTKWRESPALTMLFEEEKEIKFQMIMESEISASLFSPKKENIFISHMKSEGKYNYITPEQRIRMPHCIQKVRRYINV